MAIDLWLGFVVASSLLLIVPGPTILTVISYSMAHGRRANLPLIAGVAAGDSTALFLSLAGLGAVLATSAWLFTLTKWVGGLYLIYLGLRLLLAKTNEPDNEQAQAFMSTKTLFANTWMVTALNPKGIIFFIAFLPHFIDRSAAIAPQMWILSVTFVVLAVINASLYTIFATGARNVLSSPKAQRGFNIGGGSLLTLAGGWALTAKHSA